MFHKDTFRLIRKTFNRFFSLVMIVLIGVGFMMGLSSTEAIMEESVERYNDKHHLQDLQIYSSYGFDNADIKQIRKQEFVEDFFASKSLDVLCRNESGNIDVIRVEELSRTMNQFELMEGRLPSAENEILLVSNSVQLSYVIGEKLEVYLEEEDITESLRNQEYTIVGFAKTPVYTAKILGTSTYKNMDLDLIGYIPNSNFLSDYYTTVYIRAKDAEGINSFSEDYDAFMEEVLSEAEIFANRQQDARKERLLSEYKAEITKGEKELEEKKQEAEEELLKAKEALEDANIQIIAGESQLQTLKGVLDTAVARQKSLENQYFSAGKESLEKIERIEKADAKQRSFEEIYAELTADYGTYQALRRLKESASGADYSERISALESENAVLNTSNQNLRSEREEKEAILAKEEATEEEKNAAQLRIVEIDSELAINEQRIEVNNQLINQLKELEDASKDQSQIDAQLKELNAKYDGSIESTYTEYNSLITDQITYQAMKEEAEVAQSAIDKAKAEITALEKELKDGKAEYEKGKKEYQEALITFNEEIEKAEADIRKAYQELEELPDAKWILLDRNSHYSSYMYANNCTQMGAIGIALPILFYLVAALVCMTTMTRLVDEQRGQIGIFRALGFSKVQIISKYVIYAVSASLIGSSVGIFFGMAIFPTVIYNTWRLMYDLPEIHLFFPLKNILVCYVAFSLLMALVTLYVVNKTLAEMPSQLLRPKAPKNAKKVFLEHIPIIWKHLSFTSKITARNLIRYKVRFFMTVLGVAGCTGLLVVGWGIKDSIADVVALQFGDIFNYDYNISLENDHSIDEMLEILKNDLDNEQVVPYMAYSSMLYMDSDSKSINVEVLDARSANDIYNFRSTDHKREIRLNNSGVFISEKFAQDNNIKKGDIITIESRNGIKADVKVNEVCEMYFQHYIFLSEAYYDTIFAEPIHYNNISLKNKTENLKIPEIEALDGYENIADFSSFIKQFDVMIEALDFIILVIIITAGSLAFVVLINLTQVNISERIREIATLKVLGFHNMEVNSYIFKEILVLTLIGGIAGLPLGVVEHHFIMRVINMEMIMFPQSIKPISFLYSFLVTMLFTLIVLFMMRKPLKKIEMIESLKSVE